MLNFTIIEDDKIHGVLMVNKQGIGFLTRDMKGDGDIELVAAPVDYLKKLEQNGAKILTKEPPVSTYTQLGALPTPTLIKPNSQFICPSRHGMFVSTKPFAITWRGGIEDRDAVQNGLEYHLEWCTDDWPTKVFLCVDEPEVVYIPL